MLCGCAKSEEEIVDFGRVDIVKLITPVMECYDYNLIIEDDEVADSEEEVVEETKEEPSTEPPKDDKVYFNPDEPMHGVWVASVLNIDYPKTRTGNAEALKSQADEIINNCAKMGINNIFLQVRPCSDAFYKSDIFPTSKYLTGAQGKNPDGDFDCLEYWICKCHENNIALHAWINPYRITKEKESLEELDDTNPARLHPEWVVKHEGNLYFDPGIPEVRELVVSGIVEIIENYDVDGIHFDDYFYPQESKENFNDGETFEKYGAGFDKKGPFRRDSVDKLIRECMDAVKAADNTVVFGISPSGIWANKSTNSEGSNTSGSEAYVRLYADTRKWGKEGWIDYIIPQIYWHIGHDKANYATLVKWWSEQMEGSPTRLYVGLADYKVGDDKYWKGGAGLQNLKDQIELNKEYPNVKGEVHYNYTSLFGHSDLVDYFTDLYSK